MSVAATDSLTSCVRNLQRPCFGSTLNKRPLMRSTGLWPDIVFDQDASWLPSPLARWPIALIVIDVIGVRCRDKISDLDAGRGSANSSRNHLTRKLIANWAKQVRRIVFNIRKWKCTFAVKWMNNLVNVRLPELRIYFALGNHLFWKLMRRQSAAPGLINWVQHYVLLPGRHAGNERPATGRSDSRIATRHQGSVFVRLHRRCRRASRDSIRRGCLPAKTVHAEFLGEEGEGSNGYMITRPHTYCTASVSSKYNRTKAGKRGHREYRLATSHPGIARSELSQRTVYSRPASTRLTSTFFPKALA